VSPKREGKPELERGVIGRGGGESSGAEKEFSGKRRTEGTYQVMLGKGSASWGKQLSMRSRRGEGMRIFSRKFGRLREEVCEGRGGEEKFSERRKEIAVVEGTREVIPLKESVLDN